MLLFYAILSDAGRRIRARGDFVPPLADLGHDRDTSLGGYMAGKWKVHLIKNGTVKDIQVVDLSVIQG